MIDRVTKLDGEERLKDGTVLIGGLETHRERDREGDRQLWFGWDCSQRSSSEE